MKYANAGRAVITESPSQSPEFYWPSDNSWCKVASILLITESFFVVKQVIMASFRTKEMNPQISQMVADSRDQQTHAIIGAAMEVHRQLGPGSLEAVYQQSLAIEFSARTIPFAPEVELPAS
jgi:hypothetical protein